MVNDYWLVIKRITFISLVVVLSVVNSGFCEGNDAFVSKKDWVVQNFGVFKVPDKFYAKDISDFDKLLPEQRKIITEGTGCIKGQMPLIDDPDVSIYQMTINDQQVYHQAWLVLVKAKKPSVNVDAFRSMLDNIVTRTSLIKGYADMVHDIDKLRYNDSKLGVGLKVLELTSLEFPEVNRTKAIGGSARVLVNIKGLVFPLYVKGYLFTVDNCFAGAGLVTADNDRKFWEAVMRGMIDSLEI
jgi:hypothetical protein